MKANSKTKANGKRKVAKKADKKVTTKAKAPPPKTSSLAERAMLARFHSGYWSGQKMAKDANSKTAEAYDANAKFLRTIKYLLGKDPFKETSKIRGQARMYHYEMTLPYTDRGFGLLPSELFVEYLQKMREYQAEFVEAFEAELALYRDRIELAEESTTGLGKLFNKADYPSEDVLRRKFCLEVDFAPIPAGKYLIADVHEDELKRIQEDCDARLKESLEESAKDIWRRLHKPIARMVERLSLTNNSFRDSLVSNILHIANMVPAFNVTDDPEIKVMYTEIIDKLTKVDPETLRKDEKMRKQIGSAAADILKRLDIYVGDTTTATAH